MHGWMDGKRSMNQGMDTWIEGSGEVLRLREEAEHPGEAELHGLLTCRLHISELQSSMTLCVLGH